MNIIYLSAHPTKELIQKSNGKIDSLYRDDVAIIKGLRSVDSLNVKVLTAPDIASFPHQPLFLKGFYDVSEDVRSLSILNIPLIKQCWIALNLYISAAKIIRRNKGVTTVFIPYIVFHHAIPAWLLKCTFNKKIRLITIVPDIFFPQTKFHKWMNMLAEKCVKKSDGFVLYTKDMAYYLDAKEYEVIEGFRDMHPHTIKQEAGIFKIVYAGSLNLRYGCGRLVEAMKQIDQSDVELHLYGDGSAVNMIKEYSAADKRIHYWGRVSKEEATEALYNANVLINPRSASDGEFTNYSFPSKNLDYLASGIPCVLCKLPGMPAEYDGYFIDAGNATPTELSNAIQTIYKMSEKNRFEMGNKAQKFIFRRMDSHQQGLRIESLIKRLL